MWARGAGAQAPSGPGDPPTAPPTEMPSEPPLEFADPDALLGEFENLIGAKRMDDLFVALVRAANLTHPAKNIDPEALRRIGHNLLGLFLENEQVHYVDKVVDETHGTSLRRVVFLAYTSRDRWIYFTLILKRGAIGWQVTKFDYAVDRFDVFPAPAE
jgi:hypothetical protein